MADTGSLREKFDEIRAMVHPPAPAIGFISRIEIVDLVNIADELFRRVDDLQAHITILEEELEQEKYNHSQFGMGG